MHRSCDSTQFNIIANDPDVKPWLGFGDDSPVDLSSTVSNILNVCVLTECGRGGYLFINNGNGLYVAHTIAMKSARGKPMYRLLFEVLEYMFTHTDCMEISTLCPDGNEGALSWAKLANFRETFRRENFVPLLGKLVGGHFLSLTFLDWVGSPRTKTNRPIGETIASSIHAGADDFYERMIGTVIQGIRAGNVEKVVAVFNRWASLSCFPMMEIIGLHPITINTGQKILQMNNGSLELLDCPQVPNEGE